MDFQNQNQIYQLNLGRILIQWQIKNFWRCSIIQWLNTHSPQFTQQDPQSTSFCSSRHLSDVLPGRWAFFWPGMTSAISEMRIHCAACNRNATSQPNAPPPHPSDTTPIPIPMYLRWFFQLHWTQLFGNHGPIQRLAKCRKGTWRLQRPHQQTKANIHNIWH